jgi:hypothetical protein
VRGVLYEAAGSAGADAFATGVAEVERARELNEIPGALLAADPRDVRAWLAAAQAGIDALLNADRRSVRLGARENP